MGNDWQSGDFLYANILLASHCSSIRVPISSLEVSASLITICLLILGLGDSKGKMGIDQIHGPIVGTQNYSSPPTPPRITVTRTEELYLNSTWYHIQGYVMVKLY